MGVSYGLFNHTTKTWFDLGKGPFRNYHMSLLNNWPFKDIALDFISGYWFEDMDAARYGIWVACIGHNFCRTGKLVKGPLIDCPMQDIEVISDVYGDFDILSRTYREVGDRYIEEHEYDGCRESIEEWLTKDEVKAILKESGMYRSIMDEALE